MASVVDTDNCGRKIIRPRANDNIPIIIPIMVDTFPPLHPFPVRVGEDGGFFAD